MSRAGWARGDMLGLDIPAHAGALQSGGIAFLTSAFQACGSLAAGNRVVAITHFAECSGGSTGRKSLLSVAYETPSPELHTDLFVKFSRDFDDAIRDRARDQMEAEVRFALLSRAQGFPVAVPACVFADYHRESGTGILITQRIAFGTGSIAPHQPKCLDYDMPDAPAHYRVLVTALASLAGAHKAGRLPKAVHRYFAFDAARAIASDPIRYTAQQLQNRIARFSEFAATNPHLVRPNIRSAAFLSRLAIDMPRFLAKEMEIKRFLHANPDFIALCHWNANIDNAWFERNANGELRCGLMDWGRVGQMNVALALFGSLAAAETAFWDAHTGEMLSLFVEEYRRNGGPAIDVADLHLRLMLVAAMMGMAWLMDAPALIRREMPELGDIASRFDPRWRANETARVQLQMMTNFLNLWETQHFGGLLDRFIKEDWGSSACPPKPPVTI